MSIAQDLHRAYFKIGDKVSILMGKILIDGMIESINDKVKVKTKCGVFYREFTEISPVIEVTGPTNWNPKS